MSKDNMPRYGFGMMGCISVLVYFGIVAILLAGAPYPWLGGPMGALYFLILIPIAGTFVVSPIVSFLVAIWWGKQLDDEDRKRLIETVMGIGLIFFIIGVFLSIAAVSIFW